MEVINASGRKVSLLNDEPPAYFSHYPRPQLSDHSRKSSYSTQMSRDDSESSQHSSLASPSYSPRPTPQLLRFHSTSSQETLHTPSPMTPTYPFDPLDQNKSFHQRDPYYRSTGPYYAAQPQDAMQQPYYHVANRSDLMGDIYPPLETSLQTQFAYATPELGAPISPQSSIQPPVTATSSTSQTASTPNTNTPKIGKKKYPCPHATRYQCHDTFTTSGHAARHGKKHTGEKNIRCPTCDKAFTRKDNMKQHERTHKNQDPSSPTVANPSRRSKATRSQPPTASSTPLMASAQMDIDNDESESETPLHSQMLQPGLAEDLPYTHSNSQLSIDTELAENSRPNFERTISGGSQDGEGESPGLDALAMAASGMSG